MNNETYGDAKAAVLAWMADPGEVPEMCFPEMRTWLLDGPAAHPPEGTADWLRDREAIWERASRVVEAMDAAMPAPGSTEWPGWFGSRPAMMIRFPWATELEWAVAEMERTLGL